MNRLLLASLTLLCITAKDVAVAQKGADALKNLPDLQTAEFKVDAYNRAAVSLQAIGQDKANAILLELAKTREQDSQVITLCRMLYTPKATGEFRRPLIGAAHFLGGTDYAEWPLEPIELVDGVPFLITRGYSLGGKAEPSESYLKYCIEHCAWNGAKFNPRTEKAKQKALDKLLTSPKWKAQLDSAEKAFLSSQIR
jgi:hypothetical protein